MKPKPAASIRAAVERSLPLLQKNDTSFLRKSGCISCHNDTLTAVTVAAARKKGFRVDEQQAQLHRKTVSTYLDTWRDRALQNHGIPGEADTISYILQGLAATSHPSDDTTDAMARLIKTQQNPDGHWGIFANRPPIESSDVEVTAVSMQALKNYAPPAQRSEYMKSVSLVGSPRCNPGAPRIRPTRSWDWSGVAAYKEVISKAAARLISEQRPDGGWVDPDSPK